MLGLVQSRPLLISEPIDYASTWHGRSEIVSRDRKERSTARTTPKWRREPSVSRTRDALGAGRGDRVATLAWNGWRHLDIYYGVTSLGPFPANKGIKTGLRPKGVASPPMLRS
jgi:3-(methylthio)propionyl---CoA ligase